MTIDTQIKCSQKSFYESKKIICLYLEVVVFKSLKWVSSIKRQNKKDHIQKEEKYKNRSTNNDKKEDCNVGML